MKTYIKSPEELRAINTGINKLVKQYQDQEEPILDAEIIDEDNSQ